MTEDATAFKYTIPLVTEGGVEKSEYSPNTDCVILQSKVGTSTYTVVAMESTPHFHKDGVNVGVEKVDPEDYGYKNEQEEQEDGGGEE